MYLFIMERSQVRIYSSLSLARYAFIIHVVWSGKYLFIMEPGLAHIHLSWSRQVQFIYHGAWPGTHSFVMEAGQVPIAQSFTMKPGQVHIHSPWSLARNTFIIMEPSHAIIL
jgi:hypothetical protein